ncbi:MAG: nucleoside deaminase [Burkholderiales bacterium]
MNDEQYMDSALALAAEAMHRGDWPAGAIVVRDGIVIGRGNNRQVTGCDITLHAETEALRDAFKRLGATDLGGATMYASMEPCPMCAWAIRLAGITRLVLGARNADLNRTDLGTYSIETFGALVGASIALTTGVRNAECVALRRSWGKDQVRRA